MFSECIVNKRMWHCTLRERPTTYLLLLPTLPDGIVSDADEHGETDKAEQKQQRELILLDHRVKPAQKKAPIKPVRRILTMDSSPTVNHNHF